MKRLKKTAKIFYWVLVALGSWGLFLSSLGCTDDYIEIGDDAGDTMTPLDLPEEPICGNNVVEEGEVCDGISLNGADCTTFGYGVENGQLLCSETCEYDISECIDTHYPRTDNVLCHSNDVGTTMCHAELTPGAWSRVLTLCELNDLIDFGALDVMAEWHGESCAAEKTIGFPHICTFDPENPGKSQQCYAILPLQEEGQIVYLPFVAECQRVWGEKTPLWETYWCSSEVDTWGWAEVGCDQDSKGCWGQGGSGYYFDLQPACSLAENVSNVSDFCQP